MKIQPLGKIPTQPIQPETKGLTFRGFLQNFESPKIQINPSAPFAELLTIQTRVLQYHLRIEIASKLAESGAASMRRLQAN